MHFQHMSEIMSDVYKNYLVTFSYKLESAQGQVLKHFGQVLVAYNGFEGSSCAYSQVGEVK